MKRLLCIVLSLLLTVGMSALQTSTVKATTTSVEVELTNPTPHVVPSLREWNGGSGYFTLTGTSRICIDPTYQQELMPKANALKEDMKLLNDFDLTILQTDTLQDGDIYLTLDNSDDAIGEEGYLLEVGDSITIRGNHADGVFFGTRTLLQILVQDAGKDNIPKGTARDYPKYKMRGFMLDVARKFYTIDFLRDYVKLLSWLKMSDFHIHFSDNWGSYAAYRIESDIAGLTATDGHYTKEEIGELVALGRQYGVNIIPEIDTPGHAMPLLNVKPELKTKFHEQNLDLFNPDSLSFVKEVLAEVIPLFESPYFHIGTDEYFMKQGTYTEEEKWQVGEAFSQYIEDLSNWVRDNYNKEVIMWTGWGNMTNTSDPDKRNIIDNWEAVDVESLITEGYQMINSDCGKLYTVGNGNWRVNDKSLYEDWNPRKIKNYSIPDDKDNLLGAKVHHWLDNYRNLMTQEDSDRLLQPSVKVLAEKLWGGPLSNSYEAFVGRTNLVGNAPGINLVPTEEIPEPDPDDLAYNKPVVASGTETDDFPATYAVDLWENTRWSSATNDNQWIYIDLGQEYNLHRVKLNWETAYGKQYKIQVSDDASNWTDVYSENSSDGGIDDISFPAVTGRYIKMLGIKRATNWGYSLFSFKVYGNNVVVNPPEEGGNLAKGKVVSASSIETSDFPKEYCVDDDMQTRWSSLYHDDEWIVVDLGKAYTIDKVILNWEAAYGKDYKIQVSQDGATYKDVHSVVNGDGGIDVITFPAEEARYVKMQGVKRGTGYGYSLYEFGVYNSAVNQPVSPPTPIGPLPTTNQITWQDMGMSIFVHFGVNTFTDKEWGDGTENPNTFNPSEAYNPDEWVREFRDAGFKQVVLTAKHHDGFCLWPSAYTDHDVASSTWKDGKGDVVKDVADACEKYGLKFGVYLSPWDRHEKTFGTGSGYDTFYKNQLTELLENYGTISEVWWDGAGSQHQTYDYKGWHDLVRSKQPNTVIFGCFGFANYADIHWIGNEHGYAGEPNWAMLNPQVIAVEDTNILPHGQLDGSKWIPGEADVSIRPGWFYHASQDSKVKSLSKLVDIYLSSIGHNAGLLLNVPPDRRGLIHENDVQRLKEFKKWIDETYKVNLASNAVATATYTRGEGYTADKVLDNDPSTYWSTDDQINAASIEIDLQGVKDFDLIEIREAIQLGQRVTAYNVEVWDGSSWQRIQEKQSIGNNRLLHFTPVSASKLRLNITGARGCPAIESIRVFKQGAVTGGENPNPNGNLALGKTVTVSDVHSSAYSGSMAVDGNGETRWATSDQIQNCYLEVDFLGQTSFNKVVIKQLQERINGYKLQYFNGFSWVDVYSGNSPGEVETITFEGVTSNKVKLLIESVHGEYGPSIYEFEVYQE